MGIEYKVSWRRLAWSPTTWPRRMLFRSWASAVKQAKKLEDNQHRYGPVVITIHQRTVGHWQETVYGRGVDHFDVDLENVDVGDEGPRADSS